MDEQDRLAEIRARAEAARQAAASGTTGTPPNIDGLSVNDALDIFHESAEDVPWLLEEVETLREGIATGDRMLNQAMLRAEGAEAEVEQLREYIDRMPYPSDMDELRAERDRAREDCGHQKAMRAFAEEERDLFLKRYKEASDRCVRLAAELAAEEREHEKSLALMESALDQRDRLAATVERVRAAVDELDRARAAGGIYTYGQIQYALRAALNEGDET